MFNLNSSDSQLVGPIFKVPLHPWLREWDLAHKEPKLPQTVDSVDPGTSGTWNPCSTPFTHPQLHHPYGAVTWPAGHCIVRCLGYPLSSVGSWLGWATHLGEGLKFPSLVFHFAAPSRCPSQPSGDSCLCFSCYVDHREYCAYISTQSQAIYAV